MDLPLLSWDVGVGHHRVLLARATEFPSSGNSGVKWCLADVVLDGIYKLSFTDPRGR